MNKRNEHSDQTAIIRNYFANPERRIHLQKGDVLLHQYAKNHRLYYVRQGTVVGTLPDKHYLEPIFEVSAGSFAGIYSFCSGDHISYSQVTAIEPSEVYYYERKTEIPEEETGFRDFLYRLVVLELRSRQEFAAQMASERQQVMNKLIQTEKMATLGQLSAGIAHELNNTIGALSANLRQLEEDVQRLLKHSKPAASLRFFTRGLDEGLQVDSAAARKARLNWPDKEAWNTQTLKKLTKAGIDPDEVRSPRQGEDAAEMWNLGYLLHDMKIAAVQAGHVISSIKAMGIARQHWSKEVDVNRTIREAIAILRNMTRNIPVELELDENLPLVEGSHGELVQVWVNLVRNALEILDQASVKKPSVTVSSVNEAHTIRITVEDNGPGVDPEVVGKIFEPSFTTKVQGISLGLGLGLTIVQRIIAEHNGGIDVQSKPGRTRFIIRLNKQPKAS